MSGVRRLQLQARRALLRQRSEALRAELGAKMGALQTPLSWVDRGRAGMGWLRRHPEWPVGLIAVLVVVRPRALLRWSGRAFGAWRLWRRLRVWLPVAALALREER